METGGNNFADPGQLTITASAQQLALAYPNTQPGGFIVKVTVTTLAYFGDTSGVTTSNGFLVPANIPTDLPMKGPVYVIGTSGTCSFMQFHN